MGDKRCRFHGFLEGNRVVVAVNRAEDNSGNAGMRPGSLEQTSQWHTLPDGIAHQPASDLIADAHQRGLLSDCRERNQFLERVGARTVNHAGNLQAPEIAINLWIDDVLGYDIKPVVRRYEPDIVAQILRAVVAEGSYIVEPLPNHINGDRNHRADASDQKGTTAAMRAGTRFGRGLFSWLPRDNAVAEDQAQPIETISK